MKAYGEQSLLRRDFYFRDAYDVQDGGTSRPDKCLVVPLIACPP